MRVRVIGEGCLVLKFVFLKQVVFPCCDFPYWLVVNPFIEMNQIVTRSLKGSFDDIQIDFISGLQGS